MALLKDTVIAGNLRVTDTIYGHNPHNVYYVKGTHTGTTGTWTGNLPDISELYEGLTIAYWLPSAPTGNATLNLTLKDGTQTGNVPCYISSNSRLTTHMSQYWLFEMVYQSVTISGTIYTGWWAVRSFDANDRAYILYRGSGNYVTSSVLYRYQLLFQTGEYTFTPLNNVDNNTGTSKTMLTDVEFDPFGEILYWESTATVAANGTFGASSKWTCIIDLRYTFNCGSTLTAHRPVYLKVSLQSNGKVKLASDSPLAQALPETNDGYLYIHLGLAPSNYQLVLYPFHRVYFHDGTSVVEYKQLQNVSSTMPGLMTSADKTKLDGLEERIHDFTVPLFSTTSLYNIGDLVSYNDRIYVFKNNHRGAWDGADVESTSYGDLAQYLKGFNVNFALSFSTSVSYIVGDYIIYGKRLYRFIKNHSAGAWNLSEVTAVYLADELKNVATSIARGFASGMAYAVGDIVTYGGKLYKFTSAHIAGNDWSYSETTQIRVTDLFTVATQSSDGLMSASDKVKLDSLSGGFDISTDTVGSASAGTAISADDITSWSAGSTPILGTAVNTSHISAWNAGSAPTLGTAVNTSYISNWSAGTAPTFGPDIEVPIISTWSAGSLPSATYDSEEEQLEFSFGVLPNLVQTSMTVPNVTSVGTRPSLTYSSSSIRPVSSVGSAPTLTYTSDSIRPVTSVGSVPSLQYTSRSIPNISVTSKTVVTAIDPQS